MVSNPLLGLKLVLLIVRLLVNVKHSRQEVVWRSHTLHLRSLWPWFAPILCLAFQSTLQKRKKVQIWHLMVLLPSRFDLSHLIFFFFYIRRKQHLASDCRVPAPPSELRRLHRSITFPICFPWDLLLFLSVFSAHKAVSLKKLRNRWTKATLKTAQRDSNKKYIVSMWRKQLISNQTLEAPHHPSPSFLR